MERRFAPRVPLNVSVDQVVTETAATRARTTDLSATGLCIEPLEGEVLTDARFAWLVLSLPAEPEPIRALGELCSRTEAQRHYRIKYIYPRDRRRYEAFVSAAAANG